LAVPPVLRCHPKLSAVICLVEEFPIHLAWLAGVQQSGNFQYSVNSLLERRKALWNKEQDAQNLLSRVTVRLKVAGIVLGAY
jgi:hypothetical protein